MPVPPNRHTHGPSRISRLREGRACHPCTDPAGRVKAQYNPNNLPGKDGVPDD